MVLSKIPSFSEVKSWANSKFLTVNSFASETGSFGLGNFAERNNKTVMFNNAYEPQTAALSVSASGGSYYEYTSSVGIDYVHTDSNGKIIGMDMEYTADDNGHTAYWRVTGVTV